MANIGLLSITKPDSSKFYIKIKEHFKATDIMLDPSKSAFFKLKEILELDGYNVHLETDESLKDLGIVSYSMICPFCSKKIIKGNTIVRQYVEMVCGYNGEIRYLLKCPCCDKIIHTSEYYKDNTYKDEWLWDAMIGQYNITIENLCQELHNLKGMRKYLKEKRKKIRELSN